MAGISVKLKHWWQERSGVRTIGEDRVSQDILHLFRLRREHRLLRMRVEGVTGEFQTLLLEVDLRGQRLLLDEPFPLPLPVEAMTGRRVEVASNEGAASTRFDSRVIGKAQLHGENLLSLEMPVSVSASQRRNHYRLTVDERTHVEAMVRVPAMGNVPARVLDLSSKGIRLELPGHYPTLTHNLVPLFLRLGTEQGMLCELQIRSLQLRSFGDDATLLGGSMDGLNPPQLQLIERFIVRCQRTQRQRELELTT